MMAKKSAVSDDPTATNTDVTTENADANASAANDANDAAVANLKSPSLPPVVDKEKKEKETDPFVDSVLVLLNHLAGQPMDGILQPLYDAARTQLNKVLGIPERVRDTSGDNKPDARSDESSERERAKATQLPHGDKTTQIPYGTRGGFDKDPVDTANTGTE